MVKQNARRRSLRLSAGVLASGLLVASYQRVLAQNARPDSNQLIEAVPTSQHKAATWRFTFDQPAGGWEKPQFDDSAWQQGPGGFGTANTPGAVVGTTWETADLWLRRKVTIPATPDPAKLKILMFHDEDVEIYFDGVLAASSDGFITSYQAFDIAPAARNLLKPGATIVLAVHCHQTTGGQGIDVGLAQIPSAWKALPAQPDPDARQRERYRAAAGRRGNAQRGQALFANQQRLACTQCHSIDGKTEKVAPDLFTVGDKFSRWEIVDAILNPSATIAVGYSTAILTTRSGDVIDGIIKDANDQTITLMGADGTITRITTAEIADRRTSNVSMMPQGLEKGLTPEEFADLIEYLVGLRLPESAAIARAGMPANIPVAKQPATLTPFVAEEHHFDHADWFGQVPGSNNLFLVCEHESGKIWLIDKTPGKKEQKTLFADFRSEIHPSGATGLLGLAFHPRFKENHKYYIQHERMEQGRLHAIVSEKTAAADFRQDSGQPSRAIYSVLCTTDVHSGGGIEFGPDGMLYIAMGDTGPQGDPQGHGQNLSLPLGKLIRIDVDHQADGKPYAIPSDNPFKADPTALPEIWAFGFREPWRFSFDSLNGDLWLGDVGQDLYEEVDLVRRGENYGWNAYEGFEPFSSRYRKSGARFIPPVFAYNRRFGNSITGGYVYRGDAKSPFYGRYICADYTSRRIWAIEQENRGLKSITQIAIAPHHVASFAGDQAGNLYVVGYEGMIYRIDFSTATPPGTR